MTNSMPKYSEAQQRRLRELGEELLAATPQQRQDAIKIAGNLLALKARKRARLAAEASVTHGPSEAHSETASPASNAQTPKLDPMHRAETRQS